MPFKYGFWSNREYHLNKMTLKELVAAYFQYYAIQVYILVGITATVVAVNTVTALWPNVLAAVLAVAAYPLAWYLLHRFVLHGRFLYKSPLTARVWKRIHFDHHQDPHNLGVLFGALYTTLPTILLVTAPIGWALDGVGGMATAIAAGMFTTCFYEFAHCIQHLSYKPRNKYLAKIKQRHMAHHFHDERGNYGITNFTWDHLFGTFYDRGERPEKSPTVFNLGYDEAEAEKYPWVKELTGDISAANPREQRQKKVA